MTRINEKGQATAEMAVSMVGIMAIMSGFLIIAQLGLANIENLLEAKTQADISSMNSQTGSSGSYISLWLPGNDEMPMTPDDQMVMAFMDDPSSFTDELRNSQFDLATGLDGLARNNFAPDVGPNVFLNGANLTSSTRTVEVQLDDASKFLYGGNTLFGIDTIVVENSVFVPALE